MDVEACPIAMSTKDTSCVSSSGCPIAEVTACADGGSGCAVSACDTTATPGHTTSTMGPPDAPSYGCSPMEMTISRVDKTACADSGSGSIVSACDVAVAPDRATSATGAPDAPSSIYSPMDVAIGMPPQLMPWSPKRRSCSPLAWRQPTPGVLVGGRGSSSALSSGESRFRQHCKRHDDQLMVKFVRVMEQRNS